MQFNDHISIRKVLGKFGDNEVREFARKANSVEFLSMMMEGKLQGDDFENQSVALGEAIWLSLDRPFYNVWPIAVELAPSVKLDLTFSSIEIPFHAIVLRFGRGHEPHRLKSALIFWPKGFGTIQAFCQFAGNEGELLTIQHAYQPDNKVEEWLENLTAHGSKVGADHHNAGLLLVRVVVFIGLLAKGDDMITPIVLAKDRSKYETTNDAEGKKWMEDRAARRAGRGYDIGKRLQLEKEKSPHFRNPHLCLFWTGEGRKVPVIKMRSGAVIQKVSMANVPTGFLGPETGDELVIDSDKTPRESFSKSRRFAILKRDGYRCQLCGKSQTDGATIHIDHRIPLAKGGANEDDNLWTLCDVCNLGKSASDL